MPVSMAVTLELSPAALEELSSRPQASGARSKASPGAELDVETDPKLSLTKSLIERLIGHKIKLLSLKEVQVDASTLDLTELRASAQDAGQPQAAGYGLEYDLHESHLEKEQTGFQAQGLVQTADGRDIKLDVSLTMSRQFQSQASVGIRAGDARRKDPLVINLSGSPARLTDNRFGFDLDADGKQEQIPFAGTGSGFLAIDANGSGAIDNGKELFGPSTGDGFAELAAHDADRNSWIDEQDPVYASLRIWARDAQGNDYLSTLQQNGVGAIYLDSSATPFDVRDGSNQDLGQVRSTGIYLRETGPAGTVQQLDLTT